MIFRLFLVAQIILICEPAFAKPITLVEFRDEFVKREFDSVKIGFVNTVPTLAASIDKQGFDAVLLECADSDGTCQAARFTTCRDLPGYSRLETLELANRMNISENTGATYAKPASASAGICVRLHTTFRGKDNFGLRHIYTWQQAVEDFTKSVDQDMRSRVSNDLKSLVER